MRDKKMERCLGFGVWTVGLSALLFAPWALADEAANQVANQAEAPPPVPSVAAFKEPTVATPAHASSRVHVDAETVAPLTIETSAGKNYYIKLQSLPGCDTLTQSIGPDFVVPDCDVLDVFIRGGEALSMRVPLGEYLIKYSTGDAWYGYKYLFGPRGGYSAAETPLEFKVNDDGLTKGFVLTLYEVRDGNLNIERLDWSDF